MSRSALGTYHAFVLNLCSIRPKLAVTLTFWDFREFAQWPHVAGQGLLLGGKKPVLPVIIQSPRSETIRSAESPLQDDHRRPVASSDGWSNHEVHSVCDRSGILECELFASAYRRFVAETIRHPVVEVSGRVKAFANGNGYTLQVEACTTQAPFDGHHFVYR